MNEHSGELGSHFQDYAFAGDAGKTIASGYLSRDYYGNPTRPEVDEEESAALEAYKSLHLGTGASNEAITAAYLKQKEDLIKLQVSPEILAKLEKDYRTLMPTQDGEIETVTSLNPRRYTFQETPQLYSSGDEVETITSLKQTYKSPEQIEQESKEALREAKEKASKAWGYISRITDEKLKERVLTFAMLANEGQNKNAEGKIVFKDPAAAEEQDMVSFYEKFGSAEKLLDPHATEIYRFLLEMRSEVGPDVQAEYSKAYNLFLKICYPERTGNAINR